MALGPQTTTFLRGTYCALVGLLLLAALAFHWHAVAVVMGGYWLGRGMMAMVRAHARPARVATTGMVAVMSLVTGVLVVLVSPWGAGAGVGLSLALFVGFQALITATIDIAQGLRDGRLTDCHFGLVALWMGVGLWSVPFLGFSTAVTTMGVIAGAVGLGVMALATSRHHRPLRALRSGHDFFDRF